MNERPWLAHYPAGMPVEIDPEHYGSLDEVFEESFRAFKNNPAFENMGKVLTYAELDARSQDFAAYLQHNTDLKPGDRIAIQMPNCLQYPIAFIGALRAGLIVVSTNPLYTPREMEHQFRDSGAIAIVIIANFAHNLEKIINNTPIKTVIITELGDLLGGLKKHLVNFVVKRVKKMVPAYNLPKAIPFTDVLSKGKKVSFARVKKHQQDTVLLQYTGGTTGLSKGAALSHRNLTANLLQSESLLRLVFPSSSTAIVPLPLYHITALHGALLFMKLGYKSLLITNPKDIPAYIKTLRAQPFHIMIGVNTLFNALANHPLIKSVDFSTLKASIGGGMAIQEAVSEKWKALTGHHITQGYGLSETSPMLTINIPGKDRPGYIGVPFPTTEIRITDDNGNDVKPGEAGELCARGPQVFNGYWNQDNSQVFHPGGWFKTGDIAVMDPDGFFKIVDRKKDMILVSGFNVYPNEVEAIVAMHPKVMESAAIGVKDDYSTEAVKLFVVRKDESLTEAEIQEFCRENLVNYKRPKHIEFRKELPKSNVGKILRRALREINDQ
jgi:long-chain acyl-CoA synthetase